jgi:hypothetical protein
MRIWICERLVDVEGLWVRSWKIFRRGIDTLGFVEERRRRMVHHDSLSQRFGEGSADELLCRNTMIPNMHLEALNNIYFPCVMSSL